MQNEVELKLEKGVFGANGLNTRVVAVEEYRGGKWEGVGGIRGGFELAELGFLNRRIRG